VCQADQHAVVFEYGSNEFEISVNDNGIPADLALKGSGGVLKIERSDRRDNYLSITRVADSKQSAIFGPLLLTLVVNGVENVAFDVGDLADSARETV
jgi:hypothetical protein